MLEENLVGGERKDHRAGERGDGQRNTISKGQVAVTASLASGTAASQHGLSPELLQDGY